MVLSVVGGVLTIIVLLLKYYLNLPPKKEKNKYEVDIENFEKAIIDRDAAQLSRMFDELRTPSEDNRIEIRDKEIRKR